MARQTDEHCKKNNVPDGLLKPGSEQPIEACQGMTPVDTIPVNLKMLANARTFSNLYFTRGTRCKS